MPQIKDCHSQNPDKQQQPPFPNKGHNFDVEQWETDMKILGEEAEKIPILPPEAFTRESIYGNHQ